MMRRGPVGEDELGATVEGVLSYIVYDWAKDLG